MVLIADKLAAHVAPAIEALGFTVVVNTEIKADDLAQAIKGVEILIVRSKQVTAPALNAADQLALVIRAGAGVNTIDLEAASNKGIYVANCPGKNTDAVAELAIGLLIAADRRIVNSSIDMRKGVWNKKEYGKARGLKGRTLGIIGLGSIGTAVMKRAKGLEIRVAAWSRSLTPATAENLGIDYCADIYELAKKSDAVTVHLAAAKDTKHLLDEKFFAHLKNRSIFVNTSRGDVVDTTALKKAIKEKSLRVGLDVFENEPDANALVFNDTELAANTACTPHIGASTDQAEEAIGDEVIRIIDVFKNAGKPINVVNIQEKTSAIYNLVVCHYNRVGVLAGVLNELKHEGINIEEMENTIFKGGKTASCTLKLDEQPHPDFIEKIRNDANIINVVLKGQ